MSQSQVRQSVVHPSTIVIFLLLASLAALFIGLSGAYIYSRFNSDVPAPYPPVMFYITIVLLGVANWYIQKARNSMVEKSMDNVMRSLYICLGFTVVFAIIQVLGWIEFFTGENAIQKSNTLAYLLVISSLHHLHVIAGLPFLGIFIWRLRKAEVSRKRLLMKNVQYVKGLARYWRFIDILWILLVAMLLISALLP